MKFSLILVLLLGSCATSFKEDPLEPSELSFLNGEYLHNIFGEETKNGHTAFFKNGVITYGDGRVLHIKDPINILSSKRYTVYEFQSEGNSYQIYIIPTKEFEIIGIDRWDVFRRIKDEK